MRHATVEGAPGDGAAGFEWRITPEILPQPKRDFRKIKPRYTATAVGMLGIACQLAVDNSFCISSLIFPADAIEAVGDPGPNLTCITVAKFMFSGKSLRLPYHQFRAPR